MLEPEGIIIHEDGSISSHGSTRSELKEEVGEYAVALRSNGVILLRRELSPPVQMAGEILSPMTVMEMINVIANAGWRGDLVIGDDSITRTLTFDQGALKSARSTAPDDRLGEVLFRSGALTRDQVAELARDTSEKRFGELAVERGFVDAKDLFNFLQQQAQSVFFNALIMNDGYFLFGQTEEEPDGATTVHLSVQGLLMEGVQRIDEMSLFRDKVPNSSLCPQRLPAGTARELDEATQKVLDHCSGEATIDEIARTTGLGEFATTKAIYHLLQQKLVELKSPSQVDPERVRSLISRFNDVLQDIFVAVATYGGLAQTRVTLDAWIAGSGYEDYFGGGVDDLGVIDHEQVLSAIQMARTDHPLEALHQALHELAAFALFSATTVLPRDQELSLARDVNARLKAIRLN